MPAGDIYMSALHFTYQGNANLYCNYFRVKTEVNESLIPSEIAVYVDNDWDTEMKPTVDSSFVPDCIEVRQVHPNNSIPDISAVTNPAGTRTPADNLPGQCSLVATLFGDVANPDARNRGRDFWTGAQEGDQAAGVWSSVPGNFKNLINGYYAARDTEFVGGSGNVYEWVIFSRTAAKLLLPVFSWTVKLMRVRYLIRTQRRRQPADPCEAFDNVSPIAP